MIHENHVRLDKLKEARQNNNNHRKKISILCSLDQFKEEMDNCLRDNIGVNLVE